KPAAPVSGRPPLPARPKAVAWLLQSRVDSSAHPITARGTVMKPILAIFLLPLAAALSACDTQNDAATPVDTQDRPANVSDPGREDTGPTASETPPGTTPGTRRVAGEAP